MVKKNDNFLYQKVQDYIKHKIQDEHMKPGDMLPTEVELEEILNVSRTTIRAAITELQYAGIVAKVQGKGTFVADPSYEEQLPSLRGFTEDAQARGDKPSSVVLGKDIILPNEELEQKLKISSTDKVLKLSRVRYVNGHSMQISTSYLPVREIQSIDWENIDFSTASLYASLENAGIILAYGEERMEVSVAGPIESALLKVPEGFPLFVTKRVVMDKNGNVIEYAESKTRGDRHKVVIKLKR